MPKHGMSGDTQAASGFIANLINGISQQPSNIRFSSQADECVNMMPTVQEQCGRRNPLETLFTLSGVTVDTDSYIHFYRRDANEAYQIIFNGTGIQVYSLVTGTAKTVTISVPGGDTYHTSGVALDNFYCYTYKDTTFIVNRGFTPAMLGTLSSSRTPEGIIKVKDCGNTYTYDVTIVIGATTFTMPTKTAASTDTVNTIASAIVTAVTALSGWSGSGASISAYGGVVWVRHATSSVSITVKDNRSGTALSSFLNQVQKTADLPAYAPDGYIVTCVGANSGQNAQDQNTLDNTTYRFLADVSSNFGSGVWREDIAAGIPYQIDPSLMPHKLVRNSDGTFTYSQITWDNRKVGDLVTNPDPNFIGQPIHSIFLASGRLGFLSGGGFALSRVDEANFFNFFKTTNLTSLDTDPVFGNVPSPQVNKAFWANQWNGELIIFGDNLDGDVSWSQTLAPNKISINTPTHCGISQRVAPVLSGSNLFYPKNLGAYSRLYQYKLDPVTGLKKADNLTSYCGSYIPKDIIQLVGTEQGFLAMLSKVDRTKVYAYNYAENNSKLVQQAFHRWEFDAGMTIYGMFIDPGSGGDSTGIMYVFYSLGGNYFIGQVLISTGATDPNYLGKCYMDARLANTYTGVSSSYNSTTNRTTVTLPHSLGSSTKTFEIRANFTDSNGNIWPVGHIPSIDSQTSTTIVLVGNWTGSSFYVGLIYDSYYDPCKFHVYTPNPDGTGMIANPWKRVTLRGIALGYNNTGFFQIQVLDRATSNIVHQNEMPIELDNIETVFDTYTLYGGFHLETILKPLESYKIRIRNNTTKPSFFTSIAWYGEHWDATQ